MLTTKEKNTRFYRLKQVIEILGGSLKLPTLMKYCREGKIEYTTSLGGGVRYLSEEQISALFLTIKRKNNT
jgi:predicted site-specific integrase-resolvase